MECLADFVEILTFLGPAVMVWATAFKILGIGTGLMRHVHTEFGLNQTTFVSGRNEITCFGWLFDASWPIVLVILPIDT